MREITLKALGDVMLDWFTTVSSDEEFNTKNIALGKIEKVLDEIGALTWGEMVELEYSLF